MQKTGLQCEDFVKVQLSGAKQDWNMMQSTDNMSQIGKFHEGYEQALQWQSVRVLLAKLLALLLPASVEFDLALVLVFYRHSKCHSPITLDISLLYLCHLTCVLVASNLYMSFATHNFSPLSNFTGDIVSLFGCRKSEYPTRSRARHYLGKWGLNFTSRLDFVAPGGFIVNFHRELARFSVKLVNKT